MYFKQEELDKLIETTDMYALVSKYVKLEKKGEDYKGLCPFHNESNPSFSVSCKKKVAKCFSCGGGGNPIGFLMQIEQISFYDAVLKLAEFNNFHLSNNLDSNYYLKKKLVDMYNTASNFYNFNLLNSSTSLNALAYLEKRGISKDVIKYFNLGYSSDNNSLFQIFQKQDFDTYEMESSGLVASKDNKYYDFFKNRIIFPITNQFGDVVALSGRVLDNSKPKYLNSKESLIFSKTKTLYNLYKASDYIKQNDRVFIFEGYMDVIAAFRGGIKEAVAGMGVSLSMQALKLVEPLTRNLICCYDSDEAGLGATYNLFVLARELGFNLKILPIIGFKDLDELVTSNNLTSLDDYVNSNLLDPFTYFFDYDVKRVNKDDFNSLELLRSRFNIITPYFTKLEMDLYFNEFYKLTGVKLDTVSKKKVNFVSDLSSDDFSYLPISCYNTVLKRTFLYAINSKKNALLIDKSFSDYQLFHTLPPFFQNVWDLLIYHFYILYNEFNEAEFLKFIKENDEEESFLEILNLKDLEDLEFSNTDLLECLTYLKMMAKEIELQSLDSIDDLKKFYELSSIREEKV